VVEEGVYFAASPGADGVSRIGFHEFGTRAARWLAEIDALSSWGIRVHPQKRARRRTILFMFTQPGDTESDIYLIENLPLTMPAGIAADRRGQIQRRWMASFPISPPRRTGPDHLLMVARNHLDTIPNFV
jgi:hypothetical protein